MQRRRLEKARRRGQALVEYALLLAGVALASVVAVAVLGRKTADVISVMASTLPGASADDNKPIQAVDVIPIDTSGPSLKLDDSRFVQSSGLDRWESVLGAGGAALLVVD